MENVMGKKFIMATENPAPIRVRVVRPVVHYIKEWRKYRNYSLDNLGKLSGISPSMISQLERGKTTYTQNTLEAIAAALEVEPWQLLACAEPGCKADLWRVIAKLDDHDMKTVLRDYTNRRRVDVEHTVAAAAEANHGGQ